jgi:hypothetical protein
LTSPPDDENVVVERAESDEAVDYRQWPIALRARLGDHGSAGLADVLEERADALMTIITERFEHRLTEECGTLRSEMVQLRADLRVDIANARADFIKWSFLFWIGQAATVAGLLIALP